jgi:ribosomal protein S17
MPYAIKLDMGDTVYAPQDDDEYIRREGKIQMRDPRFRFGVGDRVEVLMSSPNGEERRWEEGLVVALNYHEPRFGEGVTMPYQIKLDRGGTNSDDESTLIFTPRDDDAMIRRVQPASTASASKFSRRRVGRRANTIGIARHESKLGGSKLGGAGARSARAHASARPAEKKQAGEALAQWLAATDVRM